MGFSIKGGSVGPRYHFYLFERQCVYRVIHPENLLESPIFLAGFRNDRLDRKVIQVTYVQVHMMNNKSLGIKVSVCCH